MADWDREEALFADHDDIARRRQWRTRERRRQALLKALGLAAVAGVGTLWWHHGPAIPAFTFQFPWTPPAQRSSPARDEALTTASADIPAERLTSVVIGDDAPPAARPRELSECMQGDNVIDERVVECRFGELPRSEGRQPASGMVSDRYLAEYREQRAAERQAPARRASIDNEIRWIRGWDGSARYLAQWQAVDNRINGSSVCANHRAGSIDYRECRKAAKVHFREECRRWEQRSDPYADQQRDRYCHAASAFSAM